MRDNCGSLQENKGHSKYLYCITQYVISGLYGFKRFSDINMFVLFDLFMYNLILKQILRSHKKFALHTKQYNIIFNII